MELDTEAAVSIMPYTMYKEKMAYIQLQKSIVNLKTYTGQRVSPRSEITVQVTKKWNSGTPKAGGGGWVGTPVDGSKLVRLDPHRLEGN